MEEDRKERATQCFGNSRNYYRQDREDDMKIQSLPSMLSLGKVGGNSSKLQDLEDEILWEDDPNKKYATLFLRDRNANERGDRTPKNIAARSHLSNCPDTNQFTQSKDSTSYATDKQSFDDYAGPSITQASLSTCTSVMQVDVLDGPLFLRDRNATERGDRTPTNIGARSYLSNCPDTNQFTQSKASTSYATDKQSFDDYAGPSITQASLSTSTSVIQVDVLDDTTEGIEVAKEDVPKDESTISRSIAFGNAPGRPLQNSLPTQMRPEELGQNQDVPSVIFVSGIPQIMLKQDTAEDSVNGASTPSYGNMYTRKTIIILLIVLIFAVLASSTVIVTLMLIGDQNSGARSETVNTNVQFVTPTTAPTSKNIVNDSSLMPSDEDIDLILSPVSAAVSYRPSSVQIPSIPSVIPSITPSHTPTSIPFTSSMIPTSTLSGNPSLAHTLIDTNLFNFIASLSEDWESLTEEDSPQFKALYWLSRNPNLDGFTRYQKMQRYVMATLYFSTSGNDWERSDLWLSYADECTWFSHVISPCDQDGILKELNLDGNRLQGTIPVELSW
eukprot:CAMPEP_0178909172 /NCGR_PEP_ID=MMETSP0786-20121207/8347_1 /TAXON_ID=186022 /ORGANISM="Thalassionema frauenfeldii, Strain CCMP 1798" /LENGTH=557 /DNA_ID=CAMNT_0020581189 /DNA_START=146 /DNA_END=1816 /DNA_ORIENTATION=+